MKVKGNLGLGAIVLEENTCHFQVWAPNANRYLLFICSNALVKESDLDEGSYR